MISDAAICIKTEKTVAANIFSQDLVRPDKAADSHRYKSCFK